MSGGWMVAAAALAGWLWGSFLNTLVDRTPRRDGSAGGPAVSRGWFHPARSVCLQCGHAIPWRRNIPVVSFLWLRGRCADCGAAIGARTLAVESASPLLFAAGAALLWGARWPVLAWAAAALSWALVAMPLAAERRRLRGAAIAAALLLAGLAALLAA